MDAVLSAMQAIVETIMGYGPLLLLPIVFIVLGLVFRVGVARAFRSGLTIGASFTGLYLVLDYFVATIGPAAQKLGERFGGAFTYLDIGWGAFAAFAFANPIAYVVVAIGIVLNLVLLALRLTKTLNLNIWDQWEAIIAAIVVYTISGSQLAAVIVGVAWCVIHLWIADWIAKRGQPAFFGFPQLTWYAVGFNFVPIVAYFIGKILDKIPQLSRAQFTPEWVQKRFGVIGEPMFVGAILGLAMGVAAGLPWGEVLLLGVNLAAILFLMPKMVGMLMEGMVPLTDKVSEVLRERTAGRELYIGVDGAIACGHPGALATAILMVPIAILVALIIPGSVIFPLADLGVMVYITYLTLPTQRGDLLRTVIAATIITALAVVLGSLTAPYQNMVAQASGFEGAAEGIKAVSFMNCYMPEYLISAKIAELLAPILK